MLIIITTTSISNWKGKYYFRFLFRAAEFLQAWLQSASMCCSSNSRWFTLNTESKAVRLSDDECGSCRFEEYITLWLEFFLGNCLNIWRLNNFVPIFAICWNIFIFSMIKYMEYMVFNNGVLHAFGKLLSAYGSVKLYAHETLGLNSICNTWISWSFVMKERYTFMKYWNSEFLILLSLLYSWNSFYSRWALKW